LPDNIQKQIISAKKEYDSTWSGVFVPMGDEGSSQRKEYERRGKVFKSASAKYKALLTKHKVMAEEAEEPNKPDSAKEVEKGRDDKKKTRIAQLQLQIAKAQETINKMNAQEK
jgi:hypothetical protein